MSDSSPAPAATDLVEDAGVVEAAGAVPWRFREGRLEVALVHRPRYDDWSWPKGKVEQSPHREQLPVTAVREVLEETGLRIRLGRPLPTSRYTVVRRSPGPIAKQVHYWAGEVLGGSGELEHEIDQVVWLPVGEASDLLSYARDREQLRAVVVHAKAAGLQTWPLVLVRHAHAVGRDTWSGDDRRRPLDARGAGQAAALAPLVTAYGVSRVVSSPSLRCTDTVAPFARGARLRARLKEGLSEEGHEREPERAVRQLTKALGRGEPTALCSHRPVLPGLLTALARLVAPSEDGEAVRAALDDAAEHGLGKGEVMVAHVRGTGEDATVVAVERHTGT